MITLIKIEKVMLSSSKLLAGTCGGKLFHLLIFYTTREISEACFIVFFLQLIVEFKKLVTIIFVTNSILVAVDSK